MDINDLRLAAHARLEELLAQEAVLFASLKTLRDERHAIGIMTTTREAAQPTVADEIVIALSSAPEAGLKIAELASLIAPRIRSKNPSRTIGQVAWTMKRGGLLTKNGHNYKLAK